MGVKISYTDVTGQSVAASIERLSDNYFWNNTLGTFEFSVLFSDKKITMVEGSNENIGTYAGANNGNLGIGDLLVRIHDLDDNNISVASGQVYVLNGEEASRPVVIGNITAALVEALDSIEFKVTKGNSSSAQRIQRQRARKQQQRRHVGKANS
jgi:hypothetical protein